MHSSEPNFLDKINFELFLSTTTIFLQPTNFANKTIGKPILPEPIIKSSSFLKF